MNSAQLLRSYVSNSSATYWPLPLINAIALLGAVFNWIVAVVLITRYGAENLSRQPRHQNRIDDMLLTPLKMEKRRLEIP